MISNPQEFFQMAARVQNKIAKSKAQIVHVTKSSGKMKLMTNPEEDNGSDEIVFKVRETMRTLPSDITLLVNKGAELRVEKQMIMNISMILQSGML